jgi:4-carboxymuconolactone decarboxylase
MKSEMDIPPPTFAEAAPKLAALTLDFLYADIWQRPELSRRDRSLATVAALTATYRVEQLEFHIGLALDNGLTPDEIAELITHVTMYAGWPAGVSAIERARAVFDRRGLRVTPADNRSDDSGST